MKPRGARARAARGRAAGRRPRARARAPDRPRRACRDPLAPARPAVAPLVYAVVAVLAALVVTQRDSGPAQAVERPCARSCAPPSPRRPRRRRFRPAGGCSSAARTASSSLDGTAQDAARRLRRRDLVAARAVRRRHRRPRARRPRPRHRRPALAPRARRHGQLPALGAGRPPRRLPRRHALRIVYGNGEHDVLAGHDMAAGRPRLAARARRAPSPGRRGTVTVEDADTAKVLRSYRGGAVEHLAWSADGRQLLIAGRRRGTIHDSRPAPGRGYRARRRPARRRLRRSRPRDSPSARRPDRDPRAHTVLFSAGAASTTSNGRRTAVAAGG